MSKKSFQAVLCTPPEELTPQALALLLGACGTVADLTERLSAQFGLAVDGFTIEFTMRSGEALHVHGERNPERPLH